MLYTGPHLIFFANCILALGCSLCILIGLWPFKGLFHAWFFKRYPYNFGTVSGYRGGNFIIAIDDWHRISDIAAETYACLLCIHITGIRSEDRAHLLRYVAFFCCWVAKLGDGWGSVLLEVLVVAAFAVPALACLLGFVPARPGWRPLKYADAERTRGLAAGLAALLLLATDQMLADDGFMSTFVIALQEVAGAFAAYNLWTAAPTGKRGGGFLGERD